MTRRLPKPKADLATRQSTIVDFKTAPMKDIAEFIRAEQATMMRSSIRIGVALAAIKQRDL